MIKLWKFEISRRRISTIKMPIGSRILKVGIQGDGLGPEDQISDAYNLSVARGIPGVEFKIVLWALCPVKEVRIYQDPTPLGDGVVSITAAPVHDTDNADEDSPNPVTTLEPVYGEMSVPIWSIATGATKPVEANLYLGTVQLPGVNGQACFSIFTSVDCGVSKG